MLIVLLLFIVQVFKERLIATVLQSVYVAFQELFNLTQGRHLACSKLVLLR